MAEVELEELPGPLDEERRVGVSDGPVALEREPGGDADHQLLADADVEVARMVAEASRPRSARSRRRPARSRRAPRGRPRRTARAWSSSRLHLRDDAARACRIRIGVSAASSASWSRPSTRCATQPSSMKRRSMPPGQPCSEESLSTTIAVRDASPTRPAYCTASQFEPSSSSASPTRQKIRRPVSAAPTATPSPWPSEPLEISTPGREVAIRVVAERRVERAEAVERVHGNDPLRGEHGVERRRAVALREQEAVLFAEDAVVENPEDVEGRERAAVVLLVAGQPREQRRQVVVAECRRSSPCAHRRTSTKVQVKWRRELTIGELSERSGVSQSALRFYEREGLISARRTDGNQRRYASVTLRRVALVQAGKAAGHPARADPGRARRAARGQDADEARLGAALAQLAARARRAHRDARGDPRPADDVHRLRLPLAPHVRAAQPRGRGGFARRRRALSP